MRTEAEIRKKLRKTERAKRMKPIFWHVLVLDIQSEILKWVLGGKKPKRA